MPQQFTAIAYEYLDVNGNNQFGAAAALGITPKETPADIEWAIKIISASIPGKAYPVKEILQLAMESIPCP